MGEFQTPTFPSETEFRRLTATTSSSGKMGVWNSPHPGDSPGFFVWVRIKSSQRCAFRLKKSAIATRPALRLDSGQQGLNGGAPSSVARCKAKRSPIRIDRKTHV